MIRQPDTEGDLEAMRTARARSRRGQSAVDDVRAAYDEAPYESYAHPQSAPGQLAAIAWAFGLDPPDVARSRVLETRLCGYGQPDPVRGDASTGVHGRCRPVTRTHRPGSPTGSRPRT